MTFLMMIRGSIRLGVSFIFDKNYHPYANNLDLSVSEENFPKNLKLVDTLTSIAEEKGITASQLTLSWLLAQGDDIFPVCASSPILPPPSYLITLPIIPSYHPLPTPYLPSQTQLTPHPDPRHHFPPPHPRKLYFPNHPPHQQRDSRNQKSM